MLYAELIVITDGVVTKKFLENDDMPEDNVNEGDGVTDIEDWADVAAFVEPLHLAQNGGWQAYHTNGRCCGKNA